ncbi:hypothetical protein Clacol_002095 [Clathrus columnatus]|uniref:F-box domain-containing protein n=1 Tax=Clathrus columnatus TaxID=1419009 RepID=A0AAV4ZZV0_9AGAM|nr:hypothetical protein Clacol_002095 [Clathrus columnatus]
MHKILCTPELLGEISSYLSRHTHAVAARVCRLWFTQFIEYIWKAVSLNDILAVLSPFDEDGFTQPLLSESWDRFFVYSKNIRQLECCGIEYAALKHTLFWRPNGDLFSSKLVVLHWGGPSRYIDYLPSLVTSTLQVLQLELDFIQNPNMLDVFCRTIPPRSPSLRALKLTFQSENDDTQAVSRSLGELFSLLPELVLILLPSHCMTGELFTTLSRLPQLQDLSLLTKPSSLYMDDDVLGMLPKRKIEDDEEARKDVPFRSLRKIEICDSDFMMAEVLRRDIQLLKLIDLIYLGSSPHHIITLTESLHKTCPNIEKISIFASNSLPFPAIRSLLKCPALVEIFSDKTVDMRFEDLLTVATNRSSWKNIALRPVEPFSYQALVSFAQNCPHLYELGLTLDPRLGIPDVNASTTVVQFSSLTSLIVGVSELTPNFELASFLSKICSKPIKISAYGTEENTRLWKTVEKLVNSIIASQLELKTLKLKDENTELNTQSKNATVNEEEFTGPKPAS